MRLTLTIKPGAGGEESAATADLISTMYELWAKRHSIGQSWWAEDDAFRLTLDGDSTLLTCLSINETGIHRVVRTSPFDAQGRRHTTFVSVLGDIENAKGGLTCGPEIVRSYVFQPYRLVKCANGKEATDIDAVLAGELEPLWD